MLEAMEYEYSTIALPCHPTLIILALERWPLHEAPGDGRAKIMSRHDLAKEPGDTLEPGASPKPNVDHD